MRLYIRDQNDIVLDVLDDSYYDLAIEDFLKGKATVLSFSMVKDANSYQLITTGKNVSFVYDEEEYWLSCMIVEQDEYYLSVTAWSIGLEYNNETIGPYKSPKAMTFVEYLNLIDFEKVLTIGINEVSDKKISYEWTGTDKKLARLYSLANVFGAEIAFVTRLNDDGSLKQIVINVYHEHDDTYQGLGNDRRNETFYFGEEIKTIKKTEDKTGLYTAIIATGKDGLTIASIDREVKDDNGKILFKTVSKATTDYPDVNKIYAVQARLQFPSTVKGNDRWTVNDEGETEYSSAEALYGYMLSQLKENSIPKTTWEIEGNIKAKIGDTVRIADEGYKPTLYLEARVTGKVRKPDNPAEETTTFSNVKELQSQVSEDLIARMNNLIEQNKQYVVNIVSTGDLQFKNNEGITDLSPLIIETGKDLTDEFTYAWYKDNVFISDSKTITVTANDVNGKATYTVKAYKEESLRGQAQCTITNVDDGKDGQKGEKGDQGDKGSDGAPGKDGVGIKSTAITYQLGSSGTTAPTGSWQNNVPTLTQGKYLWTRTIWTYTDNTNETGYSATYIAKDGNDGSDGIAGKDGVGITSTSFLYAQSTSGTTAPSSGWSTSIPSVPAGSYLWTKTSWNYTDGTTESAYTVSLMGKTGATGATGAQGPKGDTGASGKDGVAGKDGVGISDTTIQYASSISGTTKPTSGWQSTIPTVSAGNYLWTRTTLTYSDASSEDIYSVSRIGKDGNKGDDGIAGKDGVGLSSTTINYAASTSGTTKPTSGWSTTIPSVAAGSYLWTRTVWTYTDSTSETGYSVAMMGKTGADGVAGKDGVGIKSTAVTYASYTSGTTAPSSGYTTTVPSVAKGSYLWTKTVWTYTDNSTETGYSVAYMGTNGNNGTNGVAGKDGVGITSTTITYASSTSGTTAPTSGYTASVPSVAEGSFLWTKTVWTYTDNSNETGYSVAKQGAKGSTGATGAQGPKGDTGSTGAKGADGKGVKSTDTTYASSTSGTSAPTSGYFTSVPTVAAGSFLWTKTVMTYTDNSTSTFYSVGKMGEQGPTGPKGNTGATGPKGDSTGIIAASTAPTTDLYVGKLYLNTSNGITYRYTGSSWEIWAIKAAMMDVDKLSAIIANLGDITAGSFTLPFSYTESGITFTGTLSIKDGSLFIKRTASTGAYWETSIDYRTGVTDTYFPTNKTTTTDVKFAALRAGKVLLMDSGVGGYIPAEALQSASWTNLTYASGFTTAENNPCQYRIYRQLDGSKLIRFRGQFAKTSGSMSTGSNYPFQFPASGGANFIPTEIRPDRTEMGYGATNTGDGGRLAVTPAGIFVATPAAACTYMGISGLQYIID